MAREHAVIRADEFGLDNAVNTPAGDDALPFRLDDNAGAFYRGKPIADLDRVIQQIDSGREIHAPNGKITYSFLTTPGTVGVYNNPNYGFSEGVGYTPLSAAQQAATRTSMQLWDDLIAPSITEKNGLGADIIFANTTSGPDQAWAYYPGKGQKYQSDVWVATPEVNWTNDWLNYNGYGLTTIIHEAGHALGLSHPGNYNYDPNLPLSYANYAEYAQDSEQFTIMSYWDPRETGATPLDVEVGLLGNPQTPLLHDILTIQAKYGADPTTRVGDTTYGFNSNAGRDVYNFESNQTPYLSIYDAGGNDTLDLSGAESGVFLDLRPGSFSSAAVRPTLAEANAATQVFNAATDEFQGDFALWTEASLNTYLTAVGNNRAVQIANYTGVSGVRALSFQNISIAHNTVIENAVGGSARDYLVGNDVSNRLTGNGGDDVLNGLKGDDILSGGAGRDEFRFTETGGRDVITDFVSGTDKINLSEIDANAGVAGDQAFSFVGSGAFTGAGQVRTYTQGGRTFIAGNVDGDLGADFVIDVGSAIVTTNDFTF